MANPLLTPPEGVEIRESRTSSYWFDDEGILYSVSKTAPPLTPDEYDHQLKTFQDMAQGRKFCLVVDATNASPSTRETREFAAEVLPQIVTALAIVSRSPMGRMLSNMFLAIKPQPYPAKMFNNVHDAREWLKQYL